MGGWVHLLVGRLRRGLLLLLRPGQLALVRTHTLAMAPSCPAPHPARRQVEARLRQLEGKQLAGEAAKPRGLPGADKYEPARQGGAAALLAAPKAYNADADVAPADGEKKKKKKVGAGRRERASWGASLGRLLAPCP